jgi:hypothetical protein
MSEPREKKNWLSYLPSLPAVAAVLGLVAYAGLRFAYTRFYSPIGVLPEEVGIGYAQVLAYAGPSLLLVLFVVGYFAGYLYFLFSQAERRGRQRARAMKKAGSSSDDDDNDYDDGTKSKKSRLARRRRWVIIVVVGYGVTGLLAAILTLGIKASSRGEAMHDGRRVEPVQLLGIEVLSVWATPATLHSTESQPSASLAALENRCVLYLGRAEGTAILFDQVDDVVLRVPDGAIVLEEVPGAQCPREGT